MPVVCDMDGHVPDVSFPTASPLVMSVARTFWEKARATGRLCIVPSGDAYTALSADYAKMIEDQVMLGKPMAFDQLMHKALPSLLPSAKIWSSAGLSSAPPPSYNIS